ncbi:hypothetical protein EDB85DRAFT_1886377 [Lactarius pseudohatsudake]|nr:hypothetical protein EDB85DRAFT_1886377 [Lactarius pseudohatsudake]
MAQHLPILVEEEVPAVLCQSIKAVEDEVHRTLTLEVRGEGVFGAHCRVLAAAASVAVAIAKSVILIVGILVARKCINEWRAPLLSLSGSGNEIAGPCAASGCKRLHSSCATNTTHIGLSGAGVGHQENLKSGSESVFNGLKRLSVGREQMWQCWVSAKVMTLTWRWRLCRGGADVVGLSRVVVATVSRRCQLGSIDVGSSSPVSLLLLTSLVVAVIVVPGVALGQAGIVVGLAYRDGTKMGWWWWTGEGWRWGRRVAKQRRREQDEHIDALGRVVSRGDHRGRGLVVLVAIDFANVILIAVLISLGHHLRRGLARPAWGFHTVRWWWWRSVWRRMEAGATADVWRDSGDVAL